MKFYTGIGSRETPDEIRRLMYDLGHTLSRMGWTLRSGGADGADKAFADGAWDANLYSEGAKPHIYLPWPKFNGIRPTLARLERPTDAAFSVAKRVHPAWDKCSRGPRLLHARNVHQVLGDELDSPSRFVICWTPGAEGGGGTGQAIRLARQYEIPVFDLADPNAFGRVEGLLIRG